MPDKEKQETNRLLDIMWEHSQLLSSKIFQGNTLNISDIKPLLDESNILNETRKYDELNFLDNFNIDDISSFFESFFRQYRKSFSRSDLDSEFLEYSQKDRVEFEFYFRCDNFYFDQRISTLEIGKSKLIRFSEIPIDIQSQIIEVITSDDLISLEEKKIYNTYWYLKTSITSIGVNNAIEKAIQELKTVDAIFKMMFSLNRNQSLLLYSKTSHYFYLYFQDNEKIFDYGPKLGHRHYLYRLNNNNKNLLVPINEIIRNPINDIDFDILNAVKLFGLINEFDAVDLKITLLISCLESLLVSQNTDIKSINYELGEKISYLIASETDLNQYVKDTNTSKRRQHIINRIKHFYGIRSAFSHRGKDFDKKADYVELTVIFILVLKKILHYRNEGYISIKRPNNGCSDCTYKENIYCFIEYSKLSVDLNKVT